MRQLFFYLLFTLAYSVAVAQITCTPEDRVLFAKKMAELKDLHLNTDAPIIIPVAKTFLKTPYVEKTLEIGETETLVINLRGVDCTTFVENVMAFAVALKENKLTFNDFTHQLKTIRYRDSYLNGYSSRLHYFTDWIRNNNEKGLLKDITTDLGGIETKKPINFMGTHRELYPFLKDYKTYNSILTIEEELAQETLCILPQNAIEAAEDQLNDGDIIALTTTIKGLDVTHTGFAIRMPSGRIHLLHASTSGEVTITKEPLTEYLKKIKNNNGIIVARPL